MPFVQNDKKEAFKSCLPVVETWIQEPSQYAVILRGAIWRSRRIQVLRILDIKWILQLQACMLFVQYDRKEAFENWFSDVKTWIQETSQNAVILRGAVRRSRRIQVLRILGFPKLKNLFLKNQSRGRIQTEVS